MRRPSTPPAPFAAPFPEARDLHLASPEGSMVFPDAPNASNALHFRSPHNAPAPPYPARRVSWHKRPCSPGAREWIHPAFPASRGGSGHGKSSSSCGGQGRKLSLASRDLPRLMPQPQTEVRTRARARAPTQHTLAWHELMQRKTDRTRRDLDRLQQPCSITGGQL